MCRISSNYGESCEPGSFPDRTELVSFQVLMAEQFISAAIQPVVETLDEFA